MNIFAACHETPPREEVEKWETNLELHPKLPTKEEWERILKAHGLYHDPFPIGV